MMCISFSLNYLNEYWCIVKVAIINGEQDTFIQFLYPSDGLNWLQGDFGESGLPDIRAQAGFVAEDGRFFALPGSGTENVSQNWKLAHETDCSLSKHF